MAAPRYRTARLSMDVAAIVGGIAIGLGIVGIIAGFAWGRPLPFALWGALAAVNGFFVLASAQFGLAMIDTAISTREMADAMAAQTRNKLAPQEQRDVGPRLRAER